jgi:hypothetical protein
LNLLLSHDGKSVVKVLPSDICACKLMVIAFEPDVIGTF